MDARRHDVTSQLPELAIALALAWGAGLRAYAVVFAVGLAGAMGWVELPGHLEVLRHPVVLAASGVMTLVEFGADKVPWLDSIWDAIHSFVRIPAGAAAMAGFPKAGRYFFHLTVQPTEGRCSFGPVPFAAICAIAAASSSMRRGTGALARCCSHRTRACIQRRRHARHPGIHVVERVLGIVDRIVRHHRDRADALRGQWLQMNMTTSPFGPRALCGLCRWPSTPRRLKGGAFMQKS